MRTNLDFQGFRHDLYRFARKSWPSAGFAFRSDHFGAIISKSVTILPTCGWIFGVSQVFIAPLQCWCNIGAIVIMFYTLDCPWVELLLLICYQVAVDINCYTWFWMSKSFRDNQDWNPIIQHQKPMELDPRGIDVFQYKKLAFSATYEVLQPLGIRERILKDWRVYKAGYVMPESLINSPQKLARQEVPLFADLPYLHLEVV